MTRLTLAQANTIVTAALEEGAKLGLKPLTVVVVDAGGHLVALQRQDGASTLRPRVAQGKAAGAVSLGMSSRKIAAIAEQRPTFLASLTTLGEYGIVPAAGGVLIAGPDGQPIGAVGITGDTSDNDEACALAGIKAAGLTPID